MPFIELSWNNSLGIALAQWAICCYELPKPPRDSCIFNLPLFGNWWQHTDQSFDKRYNEWNTLSLWEVCDNKELPLICAFLKNCVWMQMHNWLGSWVTLPCHIHLGGVLKMIKLQCNTPSSQSNKWMIIQRAYEWVSKQA